MAHTPFKMKGFSGFGNSPYKLMKDTRSTGRKWWDKATQIGMGAKAFMGELLGTKDYHMGSGQGYGAKDPMWEARKAYRKEKAADIKAGQKTTKKA